VKLGRVASWFLTIFGVWTLIIWPRFLKAIWDDSRSWSNGPTSFFVVHALLTAASFAAGIAIGVIGWRSLRAFKKNG
jgi:hypothetical protein